MRIGGIRQAGLSLVEMMVAMLLGLILIAGIGHLFLSANRTYMLQDELSRIQENARFAIDLIARDIRMAASTGCPFSSELANAVYSATDDRVWMAHFDKGILGIPLVNKSRIDTNAISESIVIHRIDQENSFTVASHNTGTARMTLSAPHGFNQGDLLAAVRSDCQGVSVFKAGANTTGSTVSHESASSGTLYNCTSQLGGTYNCLTSGADAKVENHTGSQIYPLSSVAYYLRESNGVPNLYRRFSGEMSSGAINSAEALLEGVEGLNLLYGYDSDADGIANQYRTAADIGLFSMEWRNVTSVRMELLVRSFQEVTDIPQSYFFAGNRITPTDNFLRRTFVMTMELRNRIPQ
ncbi:PilW family protein [Endozoicomonas arenosclerae]|uniref:PilW family protein n=1 Tax=Endozoicomonas arenosclerae TaxID=1633495 RepID=UPI000785EBDD|nr:PilW family protein [Endozoicomonas arenosclerae]